MTKNQNSKNSKNSPHRSRASTPLPDEGNPLITVEDRKLSETFKKEYLGFEYQII
jgi:hypothetical protein